MYGVDLSVQIENLMPFLGLGFGIGMIYDIAGFFRKLVKRFKSSIFVTDFCFCVFVALLSYLLFLGTTDGIIRLYLVVAEVTGAAVYFLTAGRLVSRLFSKIANAILGVFRRIFSPFCFVKNKISPLWSDIIEKILKLLENFKNKLKKRLKDTL